MINWYEALKAQNRIPVNDRLTQMFGAVTQEPAWKTITGTLPLTFRTSETALRSWTIYGNNTQHNYSAEGTLPLTFSTHTAGNVLDWVIEGNQQGVGERTENLVFTYINSASVGSNGVVIGNNVYDLAVAPVTSDETYSVLRNYTMSGSCIYGFFTDRPTYGSTTYNNSRSGSSEVSFSFVSPIDGYVAFWSLKQTNRYQSTCVKGSAAPTTYIPYGYEIPLNVNNTIQDIYIGSTPLTAGQSISKTSTGVDIAAIAGENTITTDLYNKPSMSIEGVDYVGVGERTKNKFNKNACELVQIDIEGTMKFGTQLDVKGGTQYTLINTNPRNVDIYILVHKEDSDVYQSTLVDRSPVGFTIPSIEYGKFKAYLRTNDDILTDWDTVGVTNIALYEGFVTNPTFVPFGYQIPLTITSGQQSTDYDIFIGDAPLTEGQRVTDTVEITAYEGTNTLDTTLTVKPDATITYK